MAPGCGLCKRDDTATINALIVAGEESLNKIADRFGIPRVSLKRHAPHARAASTPPPAAPVPAQPLAAPVLEVPSPKGGHPCETCRSPHREAIEAAIFELAPYKVIEARFPGGPSDNSIYRHAHKCIEARLKLASAEVREELVLGARDEARSLLSKARALLDAAEKDGTYADRARTLTTAKGIVELLARITGELGPDVEIRIMEHPRWRELLERILDALTPFPEALAAVVAATSPASPPLLT